MFTCISLRPTLLGSTKSNCGLPRSNVMSLRGECSLQSKIWRKSSCVTFGSITTHQKPLNGNILTPVAELNANQLLQLTSIGGQGEDEAVIVGHDNDSDI